MSITPVPGVAPVQPPAYGAPSPWRRPSADAVADALTGTLGLDAASVDQQLHAGATLADVAAARGVSVAKIIEAIQSLMAPNMDGNGDLVDSTNSHHRAVTVHNHHHHAAVPAAAARAPASTAPVRSDHAGPASDVTAALPGLLSLAGHMAASSAESGTLHRIATSRAAAPGQVHPSSIEHSQDHPAGSRLNTFA